MDKRNIKLKLSESTINAIDSVAQKLGVSVSQAAELIINSHNHCVKEITNGDSKSVKN